MASSGIVVRRLLGLSAGKASYRNMTEQSEERLTFEMAVSKEREIYVESQVLAFNRTHFERWEQNHTSQYAAAPLHIFVLNAQGQVIGGLTGRTHSIREWLEVSTIWVSEEWRHQGIGRALMVRAEEEARHRGCRYARLATSYFQAPSFYEKLGYIVYGTLENCPPGDKCFYFHKALFPTDMEPIITKPILLHQAP